MLKHARNMFKHPSNMPEISFKHANMSVLLGLSIGKKQRNEFIILFYNWALFCIKVLFLGNFQSSCKFHEVEFIFMQSLLDAGQSKPKRSAG